MKKLEKVKNPVIISLKLARDKLLIQQDVYRNKFDCPPLDKETATANLAELYWPDFLESMADYYYPVDESLLKFYLSDPKQYKQQTQARIENIADNDIQFELHHLARLNDHTQRLKVIAELQYRFGNTEFMGLLGTYWMTYGHCVNLMNEIDESTVLIPHDETISRLEHKKIFCEQILNLCLLLHKDIIDD